MAKKSIKHSEKSAQAAPASGAAGVANRVVTKHKPSALLDRIQSGLDQLRPSEQQVARFVLRHPNLVINLSFPEIAARTGVSQPTVARFCMAAGFSGYRDFKLRLAQSLANSVPFVHRDVNSKDSMTEVGAKVFDRAIAAYPKLIQFLRQEIGVVSRRDDSLAALMGIVAGAS